MKAAAKNRRVLVIEDDVDLNTAYCLVLSREGFEVASVKDGLEGIEKLKGFTPDLVLLDLHMKKMDGVEFLRESSIASEIPAAKVVVFTNFDLNDEIQKAFDLGASRYVLKSMVSPKQLVKLVCEELDIALN